MREQGVRHNTINDICKYQYGKHIKYLYISGRCLIVIILLASGISKIISPSPLYIILKNYTELPDEVLIAAVTLLSFIEIVVGVMLLLKIKDRIVLQLTLLLFVAFWIVSIYGTISGMKSDCGCYGSLIKSTFGLWMVIRNSILLAIVTLVYKHEIK